MRLAGALIAILIISTLPVLAVGAPLTSIRPTPRVAPMSYRSRSLSVQVFYRFKIRPRPRGFGVSMAALPIAVAPVMASAAKPAASSAYQLASTVPVYRSTRPKIRPSDLGRKPRGTTQIPKYSRVASASPQVFARSGNVCGDPRIKGQVIASIAGKLPGCGVENPVRISSIDGVVLSQASIMDCQTAQALTSWVTRGLKPAVGRKGGGVKSLRVVSHYSCRTRNSKPGARISEHGKGRAIDIAAINLNSGQQITVLDGWRSRKDKKLLKKLHNSACGPFGTVLGPEANKYHLDHFHFDTARYRGGPFCE